MFSIILYGIIKCEFNTNKIGIRISSKTPLTKLVTNLISY